MNNAIPQAWDSDLVDWTIITVALTINFHVKANNSAFISGSYGTAENSYSTEAENSGSVTHTFTFSREAWNALGVSTNAFQVAKGFGLVGQGAGLPPVFRDIIAHLFQNGYLDTSIDWNIDWSYAYTPVGPPSDPVDPDVPPGDDSGTFLAKVGLGVDLSLGSPAAGVRTPTWTGGAFSDNGSGANGNVGVYGWDYVTGQDVIVPFPNWLGLTDDGPDIRVDTLKTGGGGVNFGATLSQNDSSAVAGYWAGLNYVATTHTQSISVAITTS